MKKQLLVLAIVGLMTGCASTSGTADFVPTDTSMTKREIVQQKITCNKYAVEIANTSTYFGGIYGMAKRSAAHEDAFAECMEAAGFVPKK